MDLDLILENDNFYHRLVTLFFKGKLTGSSAYERLKKAAETQTTRTTRRTPGGLPFQPPEPPLESRVYDRYKEV